MAGTGVPYFPQTLGPNVVVGRLAPNPGPTEQIPFAQLAAALGVGGSTYLLATNIAGTNTITGTTATAPPLAANQVVFLIPANTNTGATTFDRDAQGTPKNVFCNGAALIGGELRAGIPVVWFYDGTQYHLLSEQSFADGQPLLVNAADITKKLRFILSAIATGTTRTITAPNNDLNLAAASPNSVLAGPSSGPVGNATMRALVGFDLPLRGYLSGLTMSTAGGSATMSIAAGQATDSTFVQGMTLASALAKTTSAWAVGNAQGGLDTGAIGNSTWYHFWLIMRTDTGVVDVLISLSATAPTMPTNYTLKRRIGSGKTDGSAQWTAFIQDGDLFRWLARVADVAAGNPGAAAVTRTLTVPTGVNVIAWVTLVHVLLTNTSQGFSLLSDLAANDEVPTKDLCDVAASIGGATSFNGAAPVQVRTNTSAQIRSRLSASDANTEIHINTYAWIDRRGRDS